jgi:uncharacterized protein (DUF4213/DUF364 family)
MVDALEKSHEIIKKICEFQLDYINDYKEKFGIEQLEATYNKPDESIYSEVKEFLTS